MLNSIYHNFADTHYFWGQEMRVDIHEIRAQYEFPEADPIAQVDLRTVASCREKSAAHSTPNQLD
jgi:hypothetical protein